MSMHNNNKRRRQNADLRWFFGSNSSKHQQPSSNEGERERRESIGLNKKRPHHRITGTSSGSGNGGSSFGSCPICHVSFPLHLLEHHASECNGVKSKPPPSSSRPTEKLEAKANRAACLTPPQQQSTPTITASTTSTVVVEKNAASSSSKQQQAATTRQASCTPLSSSSSPPQPLLSTTQPTIKPATATISPPLPKPPQQQLPQSFVFTIPIPGLYVIENFITPHEEEQILQALDDNNNVDVVEWKPSKFNGRHYGKRWGVHCNLKLRQVTPAENPLPNFFHKILFPKLKTLSTRIPAMSRTNWIPNEANAIDYHRPRGHYLSSHIDNRQLSKEPIANLSLAGNCYMTFRNEKHRGTTKETKKVLLKRRCLQVLTGSARYDFSHGIQNSDLLSERRVSITMRESPLTTTTTTSKNSNNKKPNLLVSGQSTLKGIFTSTTTNTK